MFGVLRTALVQPLVGYQLTPNVSTGVKFIYEYIEDKRYDPNLTASTAPTTTGSRL